MDKPTFKDFEIKTATIIGQKNIRNNAMGMKNHDSLSFTSIEDVICGFICDGFSPPVVYSEVGSRIIGNEISLFTLTNLQLFSESKEKFFVGLKNHLEVVLNNILFSMASGREPKNEWVYTSIMHYFRSTFLGFITTPEDTVIFGIGDGFYKLNDKEVSIDMSANEYPLYLVQCFNRSEPNFQIRIHEEIKTSEVNELMICSDGIDFYFSNNVGTSKTLFETENLPEHFYLNMEKLHDDTTAILIKRKSIGGV